MAPPDCARDLASRLAPVLQASADDIVFADGKVMVKGKASTAMPFREAVKKAGFAELSHRAERRDDYEGYMVATPEMSISRHGIGGVQFAEVAVDTETGIVKVERVVAVHDCGRPINPKLTESQIHGGVIQGVSYALYEERHLDPTSGHQLNANVDQYKIVGSREVPVSARVRAPAATGHEALARHAPRAERAAHSRAHPRPPRGNEGGLHQAGRAGERGDPKDRARRGSGLRKRMDSHPDPKPPRVCRRVRSKGEPGVRYDDAVAWEVGFVATATFWCVATGESVGPDDDLVHPHACGEGRVCFRAPTEDSEEGSRLLE